MAKLLNFKLDIVCDDYAETLYSAMKAAWDADGSCGVATHYMADTDCIILFWDQIDLSACLPLPFKMELGAATDLVRHWLDSARPSEQKPDWASSLQRCHPAFHVQKDKTTDHEQVAVTVRRVWGVYEENKADRIARALNTVEAST